MNKSAADKMRQLAAELAGPRQDIETAFVNAGARLSEGAALLNTLSKLFEALPEALQGAEAEQALGHLHALAESASALSHTFGQEKADLARLVEMVAAANAPISDLRRTVKMMGIVSVNARVTAAGIVGDDEDFEVFTTDIASLSDSASRTIQEFSRIYRQLTEVVDRAATQRARFEAAHADTLTGLARSLAETIEALDRQRAAAVLASAETGRVSRQIVGRIGSAVMSLQVGDATRQRVEHVENGLQAMADLAAGGAVAENDRDDAMALLAHLQQLQLTDIAAAFAQEVAQAEQDLNALASDARTILDRSRDFGGGTGQASAIASLSAQLRRAVAILNDFEAERAKLEALAGAVQETVRILLDHVGAVQDIEANMRLVSLNAAVRCAQLGPRGASLTVIATQLREMTSETVNAAQAAMGRLDQSSRLAGAFSTAAGTGGARKVSDLEEQAKLALDILTGLDQRIAAALTRLNSDGPRVIGLLDAAAQGLSGQSALAEILDDTALAIAALSTRPLPDNIPAGLSELLGQLRRNYTMEAERLIHDRLVPREAGATGTEAEPAPDMDLDAIMF